jgi:2-dehydro-3-deoxyphosphogluconate aldolase/(4S)-4-hydroxy-2-oxoglutarate aldolase
MAISELQLPEGVSAQQFTSAPLLAEGLAERIVAELSQAIEARGVATLVVSGGRSPVAMFQQLARQQLDWSRVVISLADERWVPVEHVDSNEALVRRYLLVGAVAKARFVGLYRSGHGRRWPHRVSVPGQPKPDTSARPAGHAPLLANAGADRAPSAFEHEPGVVGHGALPTIVGLRARQTGYAARGAARRRPRPHAGSRFLTLSVGNLLVPMSQGSAAMTTLEQQQAQNRMAEKIARLDAICAQARILPVITINREQDILPMADALAAGGLRTLEVTLRSALGLKAIQLLREQRPELTVGAGTVLSRQMLADSEAAGAQFIVTPGVTQDILQAGVDSPLPLLPGTSSASDIMLGHALGYRRFKLFPAEVSGGVAALKALGGPFVGVRFCPTGGVGPANIKQYMSQPNVMCVGGSWMLDNAWIKNGDWARIQESSAEALALLD